MATITTTLSNHYKYKKSNHDIIFTTDVFKIILLTADFVFNKDTHATLTNISAFQIATNYGYTQNSKVLSFLSITENNTNDSCDVVFGPTIWTASGGSIGPTRAACIYDDTTSDDTVIGCIDFGENITITDGQLLRINVTTLRET